MLSERQIPGKKAAELLELEARYLAPTQCKPGELVWDHAAGARVYDVDGNQYIDFTSGVLVTNTGHCHPKVVEAIKSQAARLLNCYESTTPERAQLAEQLALVMPPGYRRVQFMTTGSEAIETAVKIARAYTGRHEILSFNGAFHGRSYMAMSVGGQRGVKAGYGPMVPGVLHAPYAYCYRCSFGHVYPQCKLQCVKFLEELILSQSTGSLAAIIMEPYQGANGSIIPPREFVEGVYEFSKRHGALLIFDEVQSGLGRTGYLFAFQEYGFVPDLVCIAKGLGSGVPISAILGRNDVMESLKPGSLSSTFGGNPLSCAAGLASLQVLREEGLVAKTREAGEYLRKRFLAMEERYEPVGDVRIKGLVGGIEVVRDKASKEPAPELAALLVKKAVRKGLALIAPIGPYGNVIRIAPPLMIEFELLKEGADIFEEALAEVCM